MKVPPRLVVMTRNEQIRQSSFSPKAHTRRKYDIDNYKASVSGAPEDEASGNAVTSAASGAPSAQVAATNNKNMKAMTENQSPFQTQIKDYNMLVRTMRSRCSWATRVLLNGGRGTG